jgi:hypothetical protein
VYLEDFGAAQKGAPRAFLIWMQITGQGDFGFSIRDEASDEMRAALWGLYALPVYTHWQAAEQAGLLTRIARAVERGPAG